MPNLPRRIYSRLTRLTSDEPTLVRIRSGHLKNRQFVCSLKQGRSYFLGNHEPETIRAFERLVRPGATVLDVGGHQGYIAAVLAVLVGNNGRVISFEPDPSNVEVFRRNLQLNPDLEARIQLRAVALGSGPREGVFVRASTSFTGHLAGDGHDGGFNVPVQSIDAIVQTEGIVPFLIKLDIEGAETAAFEGMGHTLGRHRPRMVLEIHDETAHAAYLRLLIQHRYLSRRLGGYENWTRPSAWNGRAEYEAIPVELSQSSVA